MDLASCACSFYVLSIDCPVSSTGQGVDKLSPLVHTVPTTK
jgi:hypothetical protein